MQTWCCGDSLIKSKGLIWSRGVAFDQSLTDLVALEEQTGVTLSSREKYERYVVHGRTRGCRW